MSGWPHSEFSCPENRPRYTHYNGDRLHSAIGYVTPDDVLAGRQKAIWAERDRKLEAARALRAQRRAAKREEVKAA